MSVFNGGDHSCPPPPRCRCCVAVVAMLEDPLHDAPDVVGNRLSFFTLLLFRISEQHQSKTFALQRLLLPSSCWKARTWSRSPSSSHMADPSSLRKQERTPRSRNPQAHVLPHASCEDFCPMAIQPCAALHNRTRRRPGSQRHATAAMSHRTPT